MGLEISTNIGCVYKCPYCPQDKIEAAYKKRSSLRQMDFELFKKCIDKVPVSVDISFAGFSEPWLNPGCTKMVLYAYNKGHDVTVFTVLTNMGLKDIDLLEKVKFKNFFIHLPFRGSKPERAYLEILERITNSRMDASYISFVKDINPDIKKILIGKKIIYEALNTRAGNITREDMPAPLVRKGIIRCPMNLSANILLPNGEVALCCMDWGLEYILGNLLISDYRSLFRNREFSVIEKGMRNEGIDIICRRCDLYIGIRKYFKDTFRTRNYYRLIKKILFGLKKKIVLRYKHV